MNISATFIERPIATSLLMLAIAFFGAVAYRSLPVSDLPNVDFPTLLVTASLPGASPETMASAVATPLENQFSSIAGLDSMTSTNSLGSTQITLEFDLSRNLDGAAVDVQSAITQAARSAADRHAHAADVHQSESGRSAHPLPRADLADAAVVDARRVCRDAHCAAHLDDQRRRAGAGAGTTEIRGARAGGSARHGHPAGGHQRGRSGAAKLERQSADRRDYRTAAGLHVAGERPADERGSVQAGRRGLPQRRRRCASRKSAA